MAGRFYNGFSKDEFDNAALWASRQHQTARECQACGQTAGIILPHMEDCRPPFEDRATYWLCKTCHIMWLLRFDYPRAVEIYVERVRAGERFAPVFTDALQPIRRHLSYHVEPECVDADRERWQSDTGCDVWTAMQDESELMMTEGIPTRGNKKPCLKIRRLTTS